MNSSEDLKVLKNLHSDTSLPVQVYLPILRHFWRNFDIYGVILPLLTAFEVPPCHQLGKKSRPHFSRVFGLSKDSSKFTKN